VLSQGDPVSGLWTFTSIDAAPDVLVNVAGAELLDLRQSHRP
jgi:hypothetical protein